MTTLLESRSRPFGSTKGIALSAVIHGGLIAAAIFATSKVVLPPREKIEAHPVLFVATPPPPPIEVAPEPLPKVAPPPRAKEPEKVFKAPPRRAEPRPAPVRPTVPTTPALVAPTKVALSLPPVDLSAVPTTSDIVAPPVPASASSRGSGIATGGSVKTGAEGGGSGGGLNSGSAGRAYDENQVDRTVEVTRSVPPRYPEALKSVDVEGIVVMRFIVGADGRVERGSLEVVSTPHRLFGEAVKAALLETRYRAAEAAGRSVRQLVEQSFTFRIAK